MENINLEETTEASQEDIVESSEVIPEVPEASAEASPEETVSGSDSLQDGLEAVAETLEEASDSGTVFTPEDLENAVFNGLERWTEEGTGQIIVQYYAPGFRKELQKFTLTEICLVIIVLVLLAASILKIIGGRAHE